MQVRELMRRDVVTVGSSDTLALTMQLMSWNGIRHLPVVDDGRVVGMLSERDVLERVEPDHRWQVQGTVGEAMSAPVKTVPQTMEAAEAASILVGGRIEALPVVEAGELVGILSSTDLLGHAAQCEVHPAPTEEPTIGSLMIRKVEAVYDDDPLTDAAGRMVQHGIRHLPVVDGMMRVTGIVSERDIHGATGGKLLEVADSDRAAYVRRLRVREAMTANPRTIHEDEPLSSAVRALVEDRFGALPVVDDQDRLMGIVSYVDLLRYLGTRLAEDAGERGRREQVAAPRR